MPPRAAGASGAPGSLGGSKGQLQAGSGGSGTRRGAPPPSSHGRASAAPRGPSPSPCPALPRCSCRHDHLPCDLGAVRCSTFAPRRCPPPPRRSLGAPRPPPFTTKNQGRTPSNQVGAWVHGCGVGSFLCRGSQRRMLLFVFGCARAPAFPRAHPCRHPATHRHAARAARTVSQCTLPPRARVHRTATCPPDLARAPTLPACRLGPTGGSSQQQRTQGRTPSHQVGAWVHGCGVGSFLCRGSQRRMLLIVLAARALPRSHARIPAPTSPCTATQRSAPSLPGLAFIGLLRAHHTSRCRPPHAPRPFLLADSSCSCLPPAEQPPLSLRADEHWRWHIRSRADGCAAGRAAPSRS